MWDFSKYCSQCVDSNHGDRCCAAFCCISSSSGSVHWWFKPKYYKNKTKERTFELKPAEKEQKSCCNTQFIILPIVVAIFTSCSFITKKHLFNYTFEKVTALRSVFHVPGREGGDSCVCAGLESHHHLFWFHPAAPFPSRQHKGSLGTMKCSFWFLWISYPIYDITPH